MKSWGLGSRQSWQSALGVWYPAQLPFRNDVFIPPAAGRPPANGLCLSFLLKSCLLWGELLYPVASGLPGVACVQWHVGRERVWWPGSSPQFSMAPKGCPGSGLRVELQSAQAFSVTVPQPHPSLFPSCFLPFRRYSQEHTPDHLASAWLHPRVSFQENTSCDVEVVSGVRLWIYFENKTKWTFWWIGYDVKMKENSWWNIKIVTLTKGQMESLWTHMRKTMKKTFFFERGKGEFRE